MFCEAEAPFDLWDVIPFESPFQNLLDLSLANGGTCLRATSHKSLTFEVSVDRIFPRKPAILRHWFQGNGVAIFLAHFFPRLSNNFQGCELRHQECVLSAKILKASCHRCSVEPDCTLRMSQVKAGSYGMTSAFCLLLLNALKDEHCFSNPPLSF